MDFFDFRLKRRDFLKLTALAAAGATLPGISGCATKNPWPKMDADRPLVLKNGSLVDVATGKVRPNSSLVVEKGIIQAVWYGDGVYPENAEHLDLSGLYVIPGLIDGHCHSTVSCGSSIGTFDAWRHYAQIRRQYGASIRSGVTTLRDTGAFPGLLQGLLREMDAGTLLGPRVAFCNAITNINGGHPDIPPTEVNMWAGITSYYIGMMMLNYGSPAELKNDLSKNSTNAYFVKLTVDNESLLCGKGEIPAYSDQDLATIFDFADKNNLPVACHNMYAWGFDRMMDYPVHSLEHVVSDRLLSDREVLTMADKKVSIVPTLSLGQIYLIDEVWDRMPSDLKDDFVEHERELRREYMANVPEEICDPEIHKENMETLHRYLAVPCEKMREEGLFLAKPGPFFGLAVHGRKNLLKMKQAGITIGAGMDAGVPMSYFGCLHRELEMMTRIGFSDLEALQTATVNNARILRMEDRIGSIGEGKFADLVVLEENPAKDVRALRQPLMVFLEGRLKHSAKNIIRDQKGLRMQDQAA